MHISLSSVISSFGSAAKAKLANTSAVGEPEEQLRAPLELLLADLAELCGFTRQSVVAVGESSISDLKTRPDYAVTVSGAQVGFIEVKAPGKGADPRKFRSPHDKSQWDKLKCLPNVIYTDGNEFSLWQNGELVESIVRLDGDIESSGNHLKGPDALLTLFNDFLHWTPIPPRDAEQLAKTSARLCKFLREEVVEQLASGSTALPVLAAGWRKMLFPEATDAQFADGYAQAVTFGLLVARAKNISLHDGLNNAASQLGATNSLIGTALRVLTEEVERESSLKTSIATMTRVLDVVDWPTISKGSGDAWLYFYEDFLSTYDNVLRKKTGSYYTPPEVVDPMVKLVDEVLRSPARFNLPDGLATRDVKIADPAVGTGTFVLGLLRRLASTATERYGQGAAAGEINAALDRIFAFEMQLGPFAVAQLRIFAEVVELTGAAPTASLKMFVTDTLGNPDAGDEWLPNTYAPIAESRKAANEIKKNVPITVVIGNPPYKEKAKGIGGWVENGGLNVEPILNTWMPPASWGVGAHAKHLRNLYIYFWRWATWKVFDQDKAASTGIVCFITVAGFLNGPGFQKMRDYLRRKANDIWVIDCSPEGHQPDVPTRIFQGVQQPVCIVLASRHRADDQNPARVNYLKLPAGRREVKFEALSSIAIDGTEWSLCSSEWRASFIPSSAEEWSSFPALESLFVYNGSGVMPGRTWIIAPDAESLHRRWDRLIHAAASEKEALFHPHLVEGEPGDRHINRTVLNAIGNNEVRDVTVASDRGPCITPIRYAFRSFDRQWIIPDTRLINRPNPQLWNWHSAQQVYLTAVAQVAPSDGPALTFAAAVPDMDHFKGSFGGRAFPLFRSRNADVTNVDANLLRYLSERLKATVTAADLMAYIAAVASHPAYTARFQSDLVQPGLRIPITANSNLFSEAGEIGRRVIWLHTFGERFIDPAKGLPRGAPRLPRDKAPKVPAGGAISGALPDSIEYDPAHHRILIGGGFIEPVSSEVWSYSVSGKNVLRQWFSYRKANRERPIMGDRRPPSKLGEIQPDHWLPEYTSDLIDLLNVLTLLVELEPAQADLLSQICEGELISASDFSQNLNESRLSVSGVRSGGGAKQGQLLL